MNRDEVEQRVDAALAILRTADRWLFTNHVHERSLTHRLAVYLEHAFAGWDVDCEYNKKGTAEKRYKGIRNKNEHIEGSLVFPDIIVHRRNTSDNLLVIEAKVGWGRTRDEQHDRNKLTAFIGETREIPDPYQYGLFVRFMEDATVELDWFAV